MKLQSTGNRVPSLADVDRLETCAGLGSRHANADRRTSVLGLRRRPARARVGHDSAAFVTVHPSKRRIGRADHAGRRGQDRDAPAGVLKDVAPSRSSAALDCTLLLGVLALDAPHFLFAEAGIHIDAGVDCVVDGQANGHGLAAAQRPIQRFFQVFQDDKSQKLIVLHDLAERPAGFPALLAVDRGQATSW